MSESRAGLSVIRGVLRFIGLVFWLLFSLAAFGLTLLFNRKRIAEVPMMFHRGCCRILGLNVVVVGDMDQSRPGLSLGNHVSYLDIFVLGGVIPGFFIAKSEVADWPLLGTLARLQNTLFFERKGRRAAQQVAQMQQHLKEDGRLILFPEGTSTLGVDVLPFKSTLFKAAELDDGQQVNIQTFALIHTDTKGQTPDLKQRGYYAWFDDTTFVAHFLAALAAPKATIELHFADVVTLEQFEDRKACAQHCHAEVLKRLRAAIPTDSVQSEASAA